MDKICSIALRLSGIVLAMGVAIFLVGLYAYKQLDIEAYPNPVPPMIEVITQPSGWSAEEVERYVTIPLETGFNGMKGLDHIRSQSLFGLSSVKCYFQWDVTYTEAEQRVINRLNFIKLPSDLQPQLSPWNAIGEIYRYLLRGKGYSLSDLKTAQDWILEKNFRQVNGVIDVVSFGGLTKQYQVNIDPRQLHGQNIPLAQVTTAIQNANQNVGGQHITVGEQSYNIRGIGLIRSLRDIGNIVVAQKNGVPVRIRDLGNVLVGATPRLGMVGKDLDDDVVQGVVLMRYGGDTMKTLGGVHERVEIIRQNHLLPPGMEIVPYYDRSELVRVTTHTVLENLLIGMGLVTLTLFLFLGHVRVALLTAINIPLALFIAFIGMVFSGTPANLISLGAVDFGIVVESTVIMVENIHRHLGRESQLSITQRIVAAASEIGRPLLSSTLILAVAFLPLLTLSGVAGVIFSPMAHTYAFAIIGAVFLAITLTPVLASRFLHVAVESPEKESWLMAKLNRIYAPIFEFALRRKKTAIAIGLLPLAVSILLAPYIGLEFMPKLEEGNIYIRATLPMSISFERSTEYASRMRRVILGKHTRPEIRTVVSQLGRPDDGTDVSGFNNVEFLAPLKPFKDWPSGQTKEKLTETLSKELQNEFPGVIFNFSQAILDNVEEAMSGVKGENTIKVVGPNIRMNEVKANEIITVMSSIRGVQDLGIFRSLGQPAIRITPDRIQCGRYGLNVGDVESIVQAAIGGQALTQVYEGEKRFDLTVRWAEFFRKDLKAIRSILVPTTDGSQVPLAQVAKIVEEIGPSVVYREDNQRYTPVRFSIRGRDLGSTIAEAKSKVSSIINLPYDTHLEWAGEMDQLKETSQRLIIIIPLTLILIAFIVYSTVKSIRFTLLVLLGIPLACSGGMLALLITGTEFSISAAMGFISIFGIAIQDALIVITYAQRLWVDGYDSMKGAKIAAERGLRPVLMTTFVAMIGLLPAALSHGIGSETQKPLAIVVIGGALALTLLPRLIQPPLLTILGNWKKSEPA